MNNLKKIFIATCLISMSGIVSGQTQSFRCNFTEGMRTNYDTGKPSTKKTNDIGELVFDQLDTKKGTGRLLGNNGASDVNAFLGSNSIHIIEQTISGNINITTIYDKVKKGLDNHPVVHSRHLNLPGSGPLPSQFVGLCKKLN